MDTAATTLKIDSLADNTGIFGHPRGYRRSFTEFWAVQLLRHALDLILYMTATVAGGLGFDTKAAATLYGNYDVGTCGRPEVNG